MKHSIPADRLGPWGEMMAQAVDKCVHCGFCLPTCPTYLVLQEEMDSPRGRIVLMKSILEGSLNLDESLLYIDRCLGCQACVTACPSGVPYEELLTPFRMHTQEHRRQALTDRVARGLILNTLPFPSRFRLAILVGRLAKPMARWMPEKLQAMVKLVPDGFPEGRKLPLVYPAQGKVRARVALLAGCVQQVLAPGINWATLRVLAINGVEVLIPTGQGCCGALSMHNGADRQARRLSLKTMQVFPEDIDAILTNAAGCGSGMREYPLLFKGTEWEPQAKAFSKKVQDISIFLENLGVVSPPPLSEPVKLAYHDACHLAHAQGITIEPRSLLGKIPNLTLVPVPESEVCCGSAGTYNLEQPEIASRLGVRKAHNILQTGAQGVVTGNIGCVIQLRKYLIESDRAGRNRTFPVWHTIELLDQAYKNSN